MHRFALILVLALAACPKDPVDVDRKDAGPVDSGPIVVADAGSAPDAGPCVPEQTATDPNNCGECGHVCAFFGAEALCEDGQCVMGSCRQGFHDLDDDPSTGCEYECTVTDPLDPVDSQGMDENCDGFDGVISRIIFVANDGDANGSGGPEDPTDSLESALDLVDEDLGRQRIIFAEGDYSVANVDEVPAGVSLIGGYLADGRWTRSALARARLVDLSQALELGGGEGVLLDSLIITAPSADGDSPGAMAAALIIEDGEGVSVFNSVFEAGRGSNGVVGLGGTAGADGGDAGNGLPGCEDDILTCDSCSRPNAGLGGSSPCRMPGAAGGRSAIGGNSGSAGSHAIGGARGGQGGARDNPGRDGESGAPGAAGIDGRGGAALGTFSGSRYNSADGANGGDGSAGNGGGGGGGGGGGDLLCNSYGGSGGGGGGGGCGGLAAGGGSGGGASIAVLVLSGGASFDSCIFRTAGGGHGAAGAAGGSGGVGGDGGRGGSGEDDSGAGGSGGAGGGGGRGGHGGGGGGGPSIGIWSIDGTSFEVAGCTFELGPGGSGGGSVVNPGAPGAREQVVIGRN